MNRFEENELRDTLNLLEVVISSLMGHADIEELEGDYLHAIASLTPAHATAIYIMKPSSLKPVRIAARGVDEGFLSYYEDRGREVDPLRRWITANRRPNQSQLLLGLSGWQHHPVYRIVGTAEIDFAMQSPILSGPDIIGTLNFGRHLSEGAFSEGDLKAISIISRFLGLSLTHILDRTEQNLKQEHFCRALNQIRQGVVITDPFDAVQYSNPAARDIAERTFGPDQPIENLPLMIQLNEKSQSDNESEDAPPFTVRRCPIPGARQPYTLFLLDEDQPTNVYQRLEETLTAREIDVLKHVEKGCHNQEIAAALGISINTVKRHLDNIYTKMDVSSRAELVAKVYRGNELP